MDWIDVEERKPPNEIRVIVAFYDIRPKVRMHFILFGYRINNRWFDPETDRELESSRGYITHWMPLPDKPKNTQNHL